MFFHADEDTQYKRIKLRNRFGEDNIDKDYLRKVCKNFSFGNFITTIQVTQAHFEEFYAMSQYMTIILIDATKDIQTVHAQALNALNYISTKGV